MNRCLQLHARLPSALRNVAPNAWSEVRRLGGACECFLEGPCFDSVGNLWCVDIANGLVLRLDQAGEWSVVHAGDGWPTGLKIVSAEAAFVTDNRWGLLRLDLLTSQTSVLVDRFDDKPLLGTNDLTIASNGDCYFTDQGDSDLSHPCGRVLRLTAAGHLDLVADGLPSPNGLVLSRDEAILFIAVTQANAIWRLALRPDGRPGKLGHFVQLSGSRGGGPDGLAIDEQDNLYVCHAAAGCVRVFDRLGEPLGRIDTCEGLLPTNLCFGWPDRTVLYVTEAESGTVQTLRTDIGGWLPRMPDSPSIGDRP